MSRILLGSSGRFGYIELPNQLLNVTEQQIIADVNYSYSLFNSFTGNTLLTTRQFVNHECIFAFLPFNNTATFAGSYGHNLYGTIINCTITLYVPYNPTTFYHELAHLFTSGLASSVSKLPGILSEGIAKYVEYIYHPLGDNKLTWDKLDSYTFIQDKNIASFGQLISSTNSNNYKYKAGNAFVSFCKNHSPNAIIDYLSDLYYVNRDPSFNYNNNTYLDNLFAKCPWNSFVVFLNKPNAIQPYTLVSECHNNQSADAWVCPNSPPKIINNNNLLYYGCNPFSRFPQTTNSQEFIWNNQTVKLSIQRQLINLQNQNGEYEYKCGKGMLDWVWNSVNQTFSNKAANCDSSIVDALTNAISSGCKNNTIASYTTTPVSTSTIYTKSIDSTSIIISNCYNNSATAWVCPNSSPQIINNNNLLSHGCNPFSRFPEVANGQEFVWNNQTVKLSIQRQLIKHRNPNGEYEYRCDKSWSDWVWNYINQTFSNKAANCDSSIVDALTNAISSGCKNNTIASYTTTPVSTSTIYTKSIDSTSIIISNCYNNSATAWVCPNSSPQIINNNNLLSHGCNPFSRFPEVANAQEFVWNNETAKLSIKRQQIKHRNPNGEYEYTCDTKMLGWVWNSVNQTFSNKAANCDSSIVDALTNAISSGCKNNTIASYTTTPVSTSIIDTTSGYSISNMTDTYSTYSTNYIPDYPQEDSTFFNWKTISLLVIGGGVLLISGLTSLFCYCKNKNRITESEDTEVPNDSEGFELITKSGKQNDTSMIGEEWTLV